MCNVSPELKPSLLLHVCCGPCATHSVLTLQAAYRVTLFFSNSNIWPCAEYEKRLVQARRLAARLELPLITDVYDHERWLACVAGLEHQPEGGQRCEKCFEMNLGRTAEYARRQGFDLFTTTLSVSPHKNTQTLFRVGRKAGSFLAVDLKKKDGFKRSVELSRSYGLYRQTYCGCEFSRPPAPGGSKAARP